MRRNGPNVIMGIALAVVVLGVYLGVHRLYIVHRLDTGVQTLDFVNFDDPDYVTENRHVQAGLTWDSILWAFTSFEKCNWHPLTWLSHMADCQFFGRNPAGHHVVNAILHALSTAVLFFVLLRMTGARWPSAFVAALFGLHPQHVESVAWVTERKDVLSTFLWMLTLWAYARYAERPDIRRYALAFVFLVLGLMAKPMLVTVPFVLLLLDFWPLNRLGWIKLAPVPLAGKGKASRGRASKSEPPPEPAARVEVPQRTVGQLLVEKIPFFALILVMSAVTIIAQKSGGAMDFANTKVSLLTRVSSAFVSYWLYIGQMFWPAGLSAFYPYIMERPIWQPIAGAVGLLAMTALVIWQARRRPYLPVGWFWYLGTLVPVIGLLQVGAQAYADRFTYVTTIGLYIILAWAVADLLSGWRFRSLVALPAVAVLLACACLTVRQIPCWANSEILFRSAIAVTDKNSLAHGNLGGALFVQGRLEDAMAEYYKALEIDQNQSDPHNNLGLALATRGHYPEAIYHYNEALRIDPKNAAVHNNLGLVLAGQGRLKEAMEHYEEAIRLNKEYAEAHNNLALALAEVGRAPEAIAHYDESIRIRPSDAPTYNANCAAAYFAMGDYQASADRALSALKQNPRLPGAHNNAGLALGSLGKTQEAIEQFQTALELEPRMPSARNNLGMALFTLGKTEEAIAQYRLALQLDPNYPNARFNLGMALALQRKFDEAAAQLNAALRLKPDMAEAYRGLAVVMQETGKEGEAVKLLAEAVRLQPNWPLALVQLARLRAASVDPALRNAVEAVSLAERACQLVGRRDAICLDTLAIAYAEAGRFPEAVAAAREALALANAVGNPAIVGEVQAHLALFEAGKPLRQSP